MSTHCFGFLRCAKILVIIWKGIHMLLIFWIHASDKNVSTSVPVSHVSISVPAEEVITAEENQTLRLTCTTSVERPRSFMKWHFGNQEVLSVGGIKEPSNNASLASTIWTISHRFNRSYDGMYLRCSASNNIYTQTVLSDKKLLRILFNYGPENVLLNVSSNTSINEDDTLVISCLSTCYPQCVYTWKRRDSLLPSSNGIIVLRRLTRNDADVYTCSVRNSADTSLEANTTVRIDIRYKATIIEFGHVLNTFESPVIVREHEDLIILCKVDSFPGSKIIIRKGNELKGSIKDSLQLLITVKNTDCEDSGLYRCTAVNEHMTNTAINASTRELNVFVKCPPRAADGVLRDSFADLMQPVVLSVLVRAYPAPTGYVWYKMTCNDWSIMSTSNGVTVSSIDYQSNLTIEAFTTTYVGMYGVSVYNGLFEKPFIKVFHVYSKGLPEKPFNFNCKLLALDSKSVQVTWQEGANGGFEQTFVIQYKEEKSGNWIEMYVPRNKTGEGYHAVEINALSPGSTYRIRLFARNVKGSSNATDDWIVALPGQTLGESAKTVGSIVGGSIGGFGVGLLIGVIVFKAFLRFRRVSETKTEVAKKGQESAKNVDMYYNVLEEELQDSRNDNDKGPGSLQKQATDERFNTVAAEYEQLQYKKTDQPYEQMKAVST